ncbi:MAG: carboxypeptidase regulatory-like domain-containing protein [Acidobacteriota bacterium]
MRLKIHPWFKPVLVVSLLLVVSAPPLWAQVTTGTISGTVTDESGSLVPETTITLTHLATGTTRTVVTDSLGRYQVPGLALGSYEVKAEHSGFQAAIRTGIELAIGRHAVVDLTLRVGAVTEQIVVTADSSQVDTTGSTLAGLVDDKKIRDLPLNARTYVQLTTLEPGVQEFRGVGEPTSTFPGSGRGLRISLNGARPELNNYLLDGVDSGDAYNNAPGGAAGLLLGVETLREFQVLTNTYSAEFGRVGGGIINAVTRSGGNELHGTAFWFHRNDDLDARNFFDEGGAPEFKRNQFGFVLSGPIKKDQTFFLVSYEALRERLGKTIVSVVPDAASRATGVPVVQPYLNLYPQATRDPNPTDGVGEFVFTATQPTREDFVTARIDHRFSDQDSLFVRYTFDDADVLRPLAFPQFAVADDSRNQYLTIEEQKIISPNLLNTFRFGFNRSRLAVQDTERTPIDPALSFIPGRAFGVLLVGGLSPMGITTFGPNTTPIQNLFDFTDNVAYTRGAHSVKFGGNVKRIQINETNSLLDNGLWNFFSLQNFLQGAPFAFLGLQTTASITRGFRQTLVGFFVQDDYKLHPQLTLNLGLRYEFTTVPTEHRGRIANIRDPFNDAAPFVGGDIVDNPSLGNIAPRIGFAWDPLGDGKTAVRGGFGMYHHQVGYNLFFRSFQFTPPFSGFGALPAFLPFVNFPRIPTQFFPANIVFPTQFDLDTPTVLQYNLNIQREVVADMVFTIGYVGSRGYHLGRATEINTFQSQTINGQTAFPVPPPPTFGPPPPRVNPNWVGLNVIDTNGNSHYNSLQLGLNKRFSQGFQFQVSYTWSHSIDDSPPLLRDIENSGSIVMDALNRKRDRSDSDFDVRQNLTFNYTFDLPVGRNAVGAQRKLLHGWQLSGITTIKDGSPFTVENSFDRASTGKIGPFLTDRPNVAPGFSGNPILGGPNQYFDPAAFQLQPIIDQNGNVVTNPTDCFLNPAVNCFGLFGNAGRNSLVGPGLVNFDFSIVKNTEVSEKVNIQFRTEFFNLFNRANFSVPTGPGRVAFVGAIPAPGAPGIPNPVAGRIFKTVTPSRQIQFGLKIIF